MSATILDPACGGRMFWFDKHDPRVLFGDCRDESWELCDGRRFDVKPDQLMDYRHLPFPDDSFRLVVLDPPHIRHGGRTSYMVRKYGLLDEHGCPMTSRACSPSASGCWSRPAS